MPFNSGGVYTPPSGSENAQPGDIIRSATWNSIFTDIATALTLLGQQLYGTTSVTATPYVPVTTDSLLLVDVASASVINLPTAASRNGYPLAIKDTSNDAYARNITINANGGDTIEGSASLVINTSYGGYVLVPVSGGWIIHP